MQAKPLLKKGLVVGIIILLGMNILPSMSCLSTEKHLSIGCSPQIGLNKISDDIVNWTFNGTMGNNGWYISPLNVSCTYDHDVIAAVYSNYGGLYTGPFTIYEQGQILFYWYWVDYQGVHSPDYGPYTFIIDYLPPVFYNWNVTRLNLLGTKWLLNATVSDPTSGVAYVEFYVNDVLVGNATSPNFEGTWSFVYQGNGKVALAVAYDYAGNWAITPSITLPLISQQSQSQNSLRLQQITLNVYGSLSHQASTPLSLKHHQGVNNNLGQLLHGDGTVIINVMYQTPTAISWLFPQGIGIVLACRRTVVLPLGGITDGSSAVYLGRTLISSLSLQAGSLVSD